MKYAAPILLCALSFSAAHADPAPSPRGAKFDVLRLVPASAPPAACTKEIFGALATHAPEGTLCLCHEDKTGKPAWTSTASDAACWTDEK